jgi:hypothetical protein
VVWAWRQRQQGGCSVELAGCCHWHHATTAGKRLTDRPRRLLLPRCLFPVPTPDVDREERVRRCAPGPVLHGHGHAAAAAAGAALPSLQRAENQHRCAWATCCLFLTPYPHTPPAPQPCPQRAAPASCTASASKAAAAAESPRAALARGAHAARFAAPRQRTCYPWPATALSIWGWGIFCALGTQARRPAGLKARGQPAPADCACTAPRRPRAPGRWGLPFHSEY